MLGLRPFWLYFGAKWRMAPKYPAPTHSTIIEPFAGAAGYSCRYPDRNVILIEKFHKVAEVWRYLIGASWREIAQLPIVDHVDDLPASLPDGARWFIGFRITSAATSPRKTRTARATWDENTRAKLAGQIDRIRHWKVIEDDWFRAPDVKATWFVDPPYNNRHGDQYIHKAKHLDFDLLARGCRSMRGQVMVCENEGADWLPFRPFGSFASSRADLGNRSSEVIWTNDDAQT